VQRNAQEQQKVERMRAGTCALFIQNLPPFCVKVRKGNQTHEFEY